MKSLKDELASLLEDLNTVELAFIQSSEEDPSLDTVVFYTKIEQAGDALQLINRSAIPGSEVLDQMNQQVLRISILRRLSLVEMLSTALS